jgi:L-2-hydroxyglutarate oxidase LhgO
MALTKAFCDTHSLPYSECGKVVVARTEDELPRLRDLHARALANGCDVQLVDEAGLHELEPHARGVAALHSPRTAIVDYTAITRALARDVAAAGGAVKTQAAVASVRSAGHRAVVELRSGETIDADRVVVCAGLQSDALARASGEDAEPRIIPFRGEYWALRPPRSALVRGLIYPVPDPELPFLGIHLTRTVDGRVLVGPNAVLALAREGYRRTAVRRRDVIDILVWPGTRRMVRQHWKVGAFELTRSFSRRLFARAAQSYVPDLKAADLERADAGVRAQAVDRGGALVDDFWLRKSGPLTWVRNAPSPAATSALAIAEEIVERVR